MGLQEKIAKINKEYSIKEKEALGKLNEEKEFLIAEATVNEILTEVKNLPTGDLFTIFENISEDVIFTKNGKNIINRFIETVKNDAVLREQYYFINNITHSKNDPVALLQESLDLLTSLDIRRINKETLAECVSDAIKSINPLVAYKKISINEASHRLHENIDYLTTTKKSVKTISEFKSRLNETIDFMRQNSETKEINEGKEREFTDAKKSCIEAIEKIWESAEGSLRLTLTEIKDRLSKKEFSEVTANEDIKYIRDLKNTLE